MHFVLQDYPTSKTNIGGRNTAVDKTGFVVLLSYQNQKGLRDLRNPLIYW
jgi:hypothetical protein